MIPPLPKPDVGTKIAVAEYIKPSTPTRRVMRAASKPLRIITERNVSPPPDTDDDNDDGDVQKKG